MVMILCFSNLINKAEGGKEHRASNKTTISSLLVFGDSTVDPGNNNFIGTIFRSDFPPYGKDFKDQIPTGRFSNGRLGTDFLASFVGIKEYIPPYLDPTLSTEDLLSGVSFASAGSGFDPLTPTISNVLDIPSQLEYFKEYKRRVESAIGKGRMENHINNALFLISAGTNDFVINYFTLPIRPKTFTISAYQQFVMQNLKDLIQGLRDEGAQRMVVIGLPPMGCLPIVITLNAVETHNKQRKCIEKYSSVARDFNAMLQTELNSMQMKLAHLGFKIYYVDAYNALTNIIQSHSQLGFDEVSDGCCGTGYLEASFLCNPKSYLCPDTSRYVFFDSIHPTEKAYYNVFKAGIPTYTKIIQEFN